MATNPTPDTSNPTGYCVTPLIDGTPADERNGAKRDGRSVAPENTSEDIHADEELMLAYRDGDDKSFDTLYARHQAPLYRYFSRSGCPPMIAEDLCHEVWVSLIRTRRTYQVAAKFTTYLYRIAHSRLIDHFRHGKATPILEDAFDDLLQQVAEGLDADPLRVVEYVQRASQLTRAVEALPAVQREVFALRIEGLTVSQIATAAGIPLETAKSRLRYAIAKLGSGTREGSRAAARNM